MSFRFFITEAQLKEIDAARKKNMNKNTERQLRVLVLHAEGSSREEISLITGYNITSISRIVSQYIKKGLSVFMENKYKGNNRNLSYEEESAILSPYLEAAKAGQLVDINEIKLAYEKAIGRPLNSKGHIYRVLERHGWRKVMPRSKHPNKASEEEIASSKKNSKTASKKS
jgi:transposase